MRQELSYYLSIANRKISEANSNPTAIDYDNKIKRIEDELRDNVARLLNNNLTEK